MIVMMALAVFEESARLVAVIVMEFGEGTVAGARKSTAPESAPDGAAHGLEFATQIWPTVEFPFGAPLTDQETATSDVPETLAASEMRWLVVTVWEGGEMAMPTLLAIATDVEAEPVPEVTALAVA
jgi:hypothetical protein